MKKETKQPHPVNSISELNQLLGLPKPLHPLVCINRYKDMQPDWSRISGPMVLNLYKISYKSCFTGKFRYGPHYYDFDEGGMCFVSPNQILFNSEEEDEEIEGFSLIIHPDFIRNYPLSRNIKAFGFFSYSVSEALHLSEKEKETIMGIFKIIQEELESPIDQFSQDVIIAQIELLLNYSNRYYNRQFITRKAANHDLLTKLEMLLADYFETRALTAGLPTVQDIADKMEVSPRYLSDMLRTLTGQNAQQHIHNKLIEKAKDILSTSNMTIAEIAYQLGFEHPQSFNKLFKQKTKVSPVTFRQSFQGN